jgi:hypothetical protein
MHRFLPRCSLQGLSVREIDVNHRARRTVFEKYESGACPHHLRPGAYWLQARSAGRAELVVLGVGHEQLL